MQEPRGVADHPARDQMEEIWRSGGRATEIIEWLSQNNFSPVKKETLARYGQRYWSDDVDVAVQGDDILSVKKAIEEIHSSGLGVAQRISVSKSGYTISVKPPVVTAEDELLDLPKIHLGKKVPKLKAKKNATSDIVIHAVIPDTQIEPGRPNDYLLWISHYLKEKYSGRPIKLIHLGDHWNMGSLSSYDAGKGAMEGRRYIADIESGNRAFEILESQIADEPLWEKHFLFGNHEDRIMRAVNDNIQLEGLITLDHCITPDGWQRHGFREPVNLDGVYYSHYFYNPNTGRPYGGEGVELRLKTIGHSFVMGHQQGLKMGMRYVGGHQQVGVVAGSCYTHTEDYLGPQGNHHWRGMLVFNNVDRGAFDPFPVSLDYLCRRYEGHPLSEHKGRVL